MKEIKISLTITNRESPSLEKYLKEVGKGELLTAEQEIVLGQKIKQGDQAALERLTKANLRFVVSVAKQYQNQGISLGDLINEGNLGLIKAAKRFDATKGFKFISYAVWWIRQSILVGIAEQSRTIRLPLNQIGGMSKIRKASSSMEQDLEREPSPEEIANMLEISIDKVYEIMGYGYRQSSLDAPFGSGEDQENTLLDVLHNDGEPSPDGTLIAESRNEEIATILSSLKGNERRIIVEFFGFEGEPRSLEAIAEMLGLTRERVRQIKDLVLQRFRKKSETRRLKTYL